LDRIVQAGRAWAMTVGENGDVVVADEEMPLHSRIPTIKYIFVENTPGAFHRPQVCHGPEPRR